MGKLSDYTDRIRVEFSVVAYIHVNDDLDSEDIVPESLKAILMCALDAESVEITNYVCEI